MLTHRLIPVLLVKDHGLVKTTRFSSPKYVGDPINAIRIFNEKEVDELALLDISATALSRGPNFQLVADVASECFMPLAYGGGIRGVDDAKRLLGLGIEKVVLRSAALDDLRTITAVAEYCGSSSVVVAIDVKTTRFGRRQMFAPFAAAHGRADWAGFLRDAIDAGAGEIFLTSVDRDGTMTGMDIQLIAQAARETTVPLVAIGGVGSLEDVAAGVRAGADAVGAGAFCVYHGQRRAVLLTYPSYAELTRTLEGAS